MDKNRNSGNWNSGNWNSGNWNSGDWNSGDWNSGNRNSGNRNSGNWNSGNWNSGNWNSGNRNSGNWNSGSWNSGFFCTETPNPTFFDKPFDGTWEGAFALIPYVELPISCVWVESKDMTQDEKVDNPNHVTIGGYLRKIHITVHQTFPSVWAKMEKETKQKFLDLPNFDAEKFLKCTGVDVRNTNNVNANKGLSNSLPTEVVVGGIRYAVEYKKIYKK